MDQRSIEEQNFVERYVTGRLSPDQVERFEEYFLEHPECAAEVHTAQRLLRGLESVATQEVARTSLALGLWSRLWRGRAARLVPLLLLIAAVVPVTLQMQRIDRLEERLATARSPQVNTPIFELSPFRSSALGTPPAQLLTLSSDPEWIVLALALSQPEASSYRVELRDAAGSIVWQATDLRPDPLGRLVTTLPSTLLSAGDYEILVKVAAADKEPLVHRFAMRVAVGS